MYTRTVIHTAFTSLTRLAALACLCAAGAGAQTAHFSGATKTLGSGFTSPSGVAVDRSGNVFVADPRNNAVKEIVAADGSIKTLGSGFNAPTGVAVDGNGNVFVADSRNYVVKEILAAGGYTTVNTLGGTYNKPLGVAVDGSGNVFVADYENNAVKEILAAGGYTTVNTLGSGFNHPASLAVDGSGNVFVADQFNGAVEEIVAAGGYTTVNTVGSGFNQPVGVAIDTNGNVFVADINANAVYEIAAGDNFGAVNVGSASSTPLTLYFTFDTDGTLGSTAVLTKGAAKLDFSDAGGGTCTPNTTYSAGQSCTVNVSFKPLRAGSRYGAVELLDGSGNTLATGYVQGTGVGPQLTFANSSSGVLLPSAQSTMGSGLNGFLRPAVDGSGNVFVADSGNNAIKEIIAAGGYTTIKSLGDGFSSPLGVAVDGGGNVFVADIGNHAVKEIIAAGGYTKVKSLGSGFTSPQDVAVDGSGNVFVVDSNNSRNSAVKEIVAAGGYTTVKSLGSGFYGPQGVAVDGSGNVFVADTFNGAVKEIVAAGGYTTINTLGSGFTNPAGVAVDGSGNVFVADPANHGVKEIVAAGGYTIINTLGSGFTAVTGVAVDGSGNLFVTDSTYNNGVVLTLLDYADPPSLTFQNTTIGVQSSDSPQSVTVANVGNADLSFPVLAGNNPNIGSGFKLDASTTCPQLAGSGSTASTLAAGESCIYAVDFIPQTGGNISGSLLLTDNNLNAAAPSYATQTIGLSGKATQIATSTAVTFSASPLILGQAVTITATVSPSAPTGTVTFYDGATNLGTGTLNGGSATLTTSTLTLGSHTIKASYAGNTTYLSSSGSANLNVTYKVAALYSQSSAAQSGTTVPIKVQLSNYSGTNLSSSSIALTVTGIAPSPAPGGSPGGTFTYMPKSDAGPMYQFNVKTTSYPSGTYTLSFTATGDPLLHTVQFVIR